MLQDERHLSFKTRLENVPAAADFVVQAAEAAGLDDRSIYHCQLAVDEACTNIIEHGFAGQKDGQITLMTGIENHKMFVITIADNSPAFNPLTYEEPDPTRNLEERKGGGWGIYFIKKLMDVIDYRHFDGKNHLALYKKIENSTAIKRAPQEDNIDIQVSSLDEGYVLLEVNGQIDSHTSIQVEQALNEELLENQHYHIIVSFENVTYISSSGLKVLVTAWRKARDNNGDVLVTHLQPRILEVFEMIGFDMMFNIYSDTATALADNPIDG